MGGREGSRGYLIQAIVAILDSLNGDWSSVNIEPDTPNEKVDIIWRNENDEVTVASQVKTSQSNFGKTAVLSWLDKLIHDQPDAKIFKLTLVGPASERHTKFFRAFKSADVKDFPHELKHLHTYKEQTSIELMTLNLDMMSGSMISKVLSFLNMKGINTDYSTAELITEGLIVKFLVFSTHGDFISKQEFEGKLLGWIQGKFEDQLENGRNELKIQFYASTNLSFTTQLDGKFFLSDIRNHDWVENKVVKIEDIVSHIQGLELDLSRPIPTELEYTDDALRMPIFEPWIMVKMPEEEIQTLIKGYENITGIALSRDVFELGNLKKRKNFMYGASFGNSKYYYEGSNSEKEKKQLLSSLQNAVLDLQDLLEFWDALREYRIIPLVLSNIGSKHNEDIDIQLRISQEVDILWIKEFPKPKRLTIMEEIVNDHILESILKHHGDSQVKEYISNSFYPVATPNSLIIDQSLQDKFDNLSSRFSGIIKYLFDYEMHHDQPGFVTYEFNVKDLKPNDNIGFPTHFLTTSRTGFVIDYSINSRSLPHKITGQLNVY